MKKNVLTFLFVALTFNLWARNIDSDEQGIRVGVKIMPSIDWLTVINNDLQADGATLGFGYGAIVEYRMNRFVSLVSGINYTNLGGFVTDSKSLNNQNYKGSYKLNYSEIETPLSLKLKTPYFYKTSYFLQGGVLVGILTKSDELYYSASPSGSNFVNTVSNLTNPLRVAYQVGAGVQHLIRKKTYLFGSILFNKALSNVANSTDYTTGTNPRYNSPVQILPGSLEFSIGIMF